MATTLLELREEYETFLRQEVGFVVVSRVGFAEDMKVTLTHALFIDTNYSVSTMLIESILLLMTMHTILGKTSQSRGLA